MAEADFASRPDLDEAAALEIGMSFLKARRAASEVVAEAERLARQFVMTPDRPAGEVISALAGLAPIDRAETPEPGGLDLQSLADQVDEIEGTLLSSHERILRLLSEAPFTSAAATSPPAVQEPAPAGQDRAEGTEAAGADPETAVTPMVNGSRPSAGTAEPMVNGAHSTFPWMSGAGDTPPTVSPEADPAPVGTHVNGAGSSPAAWGPPDASSRVDVQDAGAAGERPVPPGQTWWSEEPVVAQEAAVTPPVQPAPGPAQPYVAAGQPAKGPSTLWLLNVIGFSVLLIVVVVVLMLANVL